MITEIKARELAVLMDRLRNGELDPDSSADYEKVGELQMILEEFGSLGNKGDREAMRLIDIIHNHEEGCTEKFIQRFSDTKKRAASMDALAMFELGMHYLGGIGVEQCVENARLWLTRAKECGISEAAEVLSTSHMLNK